MMLPSIDLRLQNLIKALQEVIVPALPAHESLARDQAMLVMAHLQLISLQWQSVARFEAGSLDELCTLIGTLVAEDIAPGLKAETAAALAQARSIDRQHPGAVTAALATLGRLADQIIAGDGSAKPLSPSLKNAVLAYGARQSLRDRAWFAGHNLDPAPGEVPAFETVLN